MATSSTSVGTVHTTEGYRTPAILLVQIVGAGLLLAMAGIHFYLWLKDGYRDVMPIGPLFLVNTAGGVVLAVALFAAPKRYFAIVALLSALFDAGTLGALLLSLTSSGLFGFQESIQAPLATTTIWVEAIGVVVLVVLTVLGARRYGTFNGTPRD
jgi:hypothetical protein